MEKFQNLQNVTLSCTNQLALMSARMRMEVGMTTATPPLHRDKTKQAFNKIVLSTNSNEVALNTMSDFGLCLMIKLQSSTSSSCLNPLQISINNTCFPSTYYLCSVEFHSEYPAFYGHPDQISFCQNWTFWKNITEIPNSYYGEELYPCFGNYPGYVSSRTPAGRGKAPYMSLEHDYSLKIRMQLTRK